MGTNSLAGMVQQSKAIQTKPSLNKSPPAVISSTSLVCPTLEHTDTEALANHITRSVRRRRSHALLSPINSPENQGRSPEPKRIRGRARTGTEFQPAKVRGITQSYDFHSPCSKVFMKKLTISDFQVSYDEQQSLTKLQTQVTSFFLIKDAFQGELIGMQTFFAVSTNALEPEVGHVKYIEVLNEVADSKDTVLHVIGDLYSQYICKHDKKFLLLEGDAKVYNLIQAIKHEYGSDLDWLIPFPGDWHIPKFV